MNLVNVLFAAMIALFSTACMTPAPAQAMPADFQLHDEKGGGVYDSNAHLGSPMVVEFYFNGCPACEANAPNVNALAKAWHGDKAQVVEASIDCTAAKYADWLKRHAPVGPVLNDCDNVLTDFFGVSRYPTTVVLDKNHNLLWRLVGTWSQADARRIDTLLKNAQ